VSWLRARLDEPAVLAHEAACDNPVR